MFDDIRLSETAITVLRFELRGWAAKDPARRQDAYRELADAGLMEPVSPNSSSYRLCPSALHALPAILAQQEKLLRDERRPAPGLDSLSLPALRLYERFLNDSPHGWLVEEPSCVELVTQGVLFEAHPFNDDSRVASRLSYSGRQIAALEIRQRIEAREATPSSSGGGPGRDPRSAAM